MTSHAEHTYGWLSEQESDRNQLNGMQCYQLAVSPAEANIGYRVIVQSVTPGTEVRGQIVGPRCLFAATAEVVSPLRSVRYKEDGQVALIARTAFPHPGFWNPRDPFLYRVEVELWQDGQRCSRAGFDLGFRMIEMGSSNVLVNKQPFLLRGIAYLPQSREEAAVRRRAGYNLVLAREGQWNWWVRANPMGFLLLEKLTHSRLTPQYIGLLSQQPCFLGFVLGKELLDRSPSEIASFLRPWQERRVFIGLELDGPPPSTLPDDLSFLVCPESVLPALSTTSLPKIILRSPNTGTEEPPARAMEGVLGWIDQSD